MRRISPLEYMNEIAVQLRAHERSVGGGTSTRWIPREEMQQLELHPRWRDEAPDSGTMAEYLIRIGRAVGLHVSEDYGSGDLRCRLTRDDDDEATIMWPGQRKG